MALVVPVEQAGIGALAIVELADDVHGMGVGRPRESGAVSVRVAPIGVSTNVLRRLAW